MKPLRTILFSLMSLGWLATCTKDYSFEGNRSRGFLVRDGSGNCSNVQVLGSYTVQRRLSDNQGLDLLIRVTHPGKYTVASDQVNGFSFQGSGEFADTGLVRIRIAASGIPATIGTNRFVIQYDSSFCEALVDVQDTLTNIVQTTNPDHFPIAAGNRWVYDDLSFPGDSVIMTMTGDTTLLASLHKIQEQFISFYPATNEGYFRRSGNDYFAHFAISTFTSALDYAPSIYDDVNFLQENLKTGDSWYSKTYTGRTSLGLQTLSLRYQYVCVDADASIVLSGQSFLHVYKIRMIPEVADPGNPLVATGEIHTYYYARGLGLIYAEFFNGIRTHPELQIRSWTIH